MTTPLRPILHPDPAILAKRRRQAAAIADQAVALAMDLAADFGKAMELRPTSGAGPSSTTSPAAAGTGTSRRKCSGSG